MEVVSLGPDDRRHFADFRCSTGRGRSWIHEIETFIRVRLADELGAAGNTAEAIGYLHPEDGLCAVAVWSPRPDDPQIWQNHILAVRVGHHRHGLGEQLKLDVLDRARLAEASVVVSLVHAENEPMLELNRKLGATVTPDPEDSDLMICAISLRRR